MQRYAQNAINTQGLLNTANRQIYNIMNKLTNTRNDLFQKEQMLIQLYRNEVDACRQ